MEKREIIIFSALLVYAGIRLYMKYGKKGKSEDRTKKKADIIISEKDDYEPYSGK